MRRRWPEGTRFRLRFQGEERIETLDAPKGSSNRISSESPLGQALHGWLSNPGPTVSVQVPKRKDPVIWEVLGFKLPEGEWVENRPELWEAVKLAGLTAISVGPEKIIPIVAEMRALGLLEEGFYPKSWDDLQHLIEWARSGQPPDDFVEEVAPELAYKRYLDLLNQGEYRFAPTIAALLRDRLKKPWESYHFVKEWKDRIPPENRHNLRALLTAGIGTVNHLWNEHYTPDSNLLEEALSWGKEALAIKEDPYTYCALQAVYRALNQEEKADVCLKRAEELGKPCEDTGRTIRRVVKPLSEEDHAPVDMEDSDSPL